MIIRKHLDPKIILKIAWKRVFMLTLLSILVSVAYYYYGNKEIAIDSLPASILGVALAFLIGFRVNSAYERWWEGRKLWGTIVNDSRSISRQAITFFSMKHSSSGNENDLTAEKKKFLYRQIAFVYAVKNHLRRLEVLTEIKPFVGEDEWNALKDQQNIPVALLQLHARHLEDLLEDGYIEDSGTCRSTHGLVRSPIHWVDVNESRTLYFRGNTVITPHIL